MSCGENRQITDYDGSKSSAPAPKVNMSHSLDSVDVLNEFSSDVDEPASCLDIFAPLRLCGGRPRLLNHASVPNGDFVFWICRQPPIFQTAGKLAKRSTLACPLGSPRAIVRSLSGVLALVKIHAGNSESDQALVLRLSATLLVRNRTAMKERQLFEKHRLKELSKKNKKQYQRKKEGEKTS